MSANGLVNICVGGHDPNRVPQNLLMGMLNTSGTGRKHLAITQALQRRLLSSNNSIKQKQATDAEEALKEADKRLGEFGSLVSHEC